MDLLSRMKQTERIMLQHKEKIQRQSNIEDEAPGRLIYI